MTMLTVLSKWLSTLSTQNFFSAFWTVAIYHISVSEIDIPCLHEHSIMSQWASIIFLAGLIFLRNLFSSVTQRLPINLNHPQQMSIQIWRSAENMLSLLSTKTIFQAMLCFLKSN